MRSATKAPSRACPPASPGTQAARIPPAQSGARGSSFQVSRSSDASSGPAGIAPGAGAGMGTSPLARKARAKGENTPYGPPAWVRSRSG